MDKFELENRLVDFPVLIIDFINGLPDTKAGNHLAGQLILCGTSPALNYGKAQSGESRKDFIHKIKIALIELRETFICPKIINKAKLYKTQSKIKKSPMENNELISIFVKTAGTAQKNMNHNP